MAQAAWGLWRTLVSHGLVRNVPFGETLLWCSALAVFMYMFKQHPHQLKGLPKMFLAVIMRINTGRDNDAELHIPASTSQYRHSAAATHPHAPLDQQWIHTRVMSTLKTTARAFGVGYGIKVALSLAGWLAAPRFTVKRILELALSKAHMQLGVFCGSTAFIFWAIRNVLHFSRGTDTAVHSAVAGWAADCDLSLLIPPRLLLRPSLCVCAVCSVILPLVSRSLFPRSIPMTLYFGAKAIEVGGTGPVC